MPTYTVSIGRNVAGAPMAYQAWHDFRDATLDTVEAFGLSPVFVGLGSGIWEDTREDSYTVVAIGDALEGLPDALAGLAWLYDQESIALTVGETTLVSADGFGPAVPDETIRCVSCGRVNPATRCPNGLNGRHVPESADV